MDIVAYGTPSCNGGGTSVDDHLYSAQLFRLICRSNLGHLDISEAGSSLTRPVFSDLLIFIVLERGRP